jgi:hypothetical protein
VTPLQFPELVATYRVTCGSCPFQVEGQLVDERWFYFRARGRSVELGVGNTLDDAVRGTMHDDRIGGLGSRPSPVWRDSIGARILVGDPDDDADYFAVSRFSDDELVELAGTLFAELESEGLL